MWLVAHIWELSTWLWRQNQINILNPSNTFPNKRRMSDTQTSTRALPARPITLITKPYLLGDHTPVTTVPGIEPCSWVYCFPSQMASLEDKYFSVCFYLNRALIFNNTFMGSASISCVFIWTLNKIQGLKSLPQRLRGSVGFGGLWQINGLLVCDKFAVAVGPALGGRIL